MLPWFAVVHPRRRTERAASGGQGGHQHTVTQPRLRQRLIVAAVLLGLLAGSVGLPGAGAQAGGLASPAFDPTPQWPPTTQTTPTWPPSTGTVPAPNPIPGLALPGLVEVLQARLRVI
jgi:hypothetical protein